MNRFTRLVVTFVAFFFAVGLTVGVSLDAGQCYKGCPREWAEEGPVPDESLVTLVQRSDMIFVGTVSGVEPALPTSTGADTDWEAYLKASDQFEADNNVTFTVESVWKGEKVDTVKLRGGNLLLLYRYTKKFLVFVGKENEEGLRFDINKSIFGLIDVDHPDYHWDVDLGKPYAGNLDNSFRSNKRLPSGYGPYFLKYSHNNHLWLHGDTAYWGSLKKDVTKELAALDPQFADPKKANDVFSLTTRGCQFTKDEWDREGGSGFIGWQPCPMPSALLQAYVKFLVKQEGEEK